jgi:hypothetical protein
VSGVLWQRQRGVLAYSCQAEVRMSAEEKKSIPLAQTVSSATLQ